MIIVSQDETSIINFDNIEEIYVSGKFISVNYSLNNNECIAEYKTEERAKEVLQEIYTYKAMFEFYKSNPMDKGLHEEIVNDLDKDNVLFDVYEMPED